MLFVFMVIFPAAALVKLWRNRQGSGQTPAELAEKDGALTSLTRRYAPQFWWYEVVNVYTRLIFCGLGVFFFPENQIMRVSLCLVAITSNMLFSACYHPVAKKSMRRVKMAMDTILWLVVFMSIVSWGEASESVQVACSCVLTLVFLGSCGLMWHIKAEEPEYALVQGRAEIKAERAS